MKHMTNILIAMPFILFVYAQVFAIYFLPQSLLLVHIMVLGSMTLFLFLLRWKWSFMFIVITTLVYGFALTWIAIYEQFLQQQQQIELIIMNIVYFVSIFSVWYSAYHLQSIRRMLEAEKLKTSKLQKYVNEKSSLLTNKEFTDRVLLSLVGLKRRNEMGYLMEISANILKNKQNIYNKILTETIEDSTREQFDYFTNTDTSTFLIYLQSTTEEGCQIVESRVLNKLSEKVNMIELSVEFSTKRVEDLKEIMSHFKVGSFT